MNTFLPPFSVQNAHGCYFTDGASNEILLLQIYVVFDECTCKDTRLAYVYWKIKCIYSFIFQGFSTSRNYKFASKQSAVENYK